MRKELIYPIIVGIVVSFATLVGSTALENWRQPTPLPPAQLIYSVNGNVVTKDDLKELFPGKFNDDSAKPIFASNLTISNASGRPLKDIDIVATSQISLDPKWVSIEVNLDDVILKERINRRSIDENGHLRIKVEKFGKIGNIEISVKSDDIIFSPVLDSPQENVEFRSINIPQFLYVKTDPRRSFSYEIFISLILSVLAAAGTYFYIQARAKAND